MRRGKRIVITTYGSFGDIHPYVALALELKARGAHPVIATSGMYREKIERSRLDFHAVRPDFPSFDQLDEVEEMMKRGMDARTGPEFVIKEMFMRPVRESYEDLREAARGADLLVTHPITFAGPVLAQKENIPWVSTLLSPLSFFSAYDPIFPPEAGSLMKLFAMSPPFLNRLLIRSIVKSRIANWEEPVVRLRAELGLPPGQSPIIEGQHSPNLVLALFSKVLAEPRPDWPPQTNVTGFCFYDRRDLDEDEPSGLAPELQKFLDEGPPPIVFTLGSAAVWNAGDFYRESIDAAQRLGQRAVLLIGDARNLPGALPRDIAAFDYAPFGELLPRARVVVHQGGIGTTGQALRSGRPMLVVPHSHDQPDNGWRIQRLGVGRMLLRKGYQGARVARELSELLNNPAYAQRAATVGRLVRSEDGPRAACDLIEEALSNGEREIAHGEELIHAASH